MVFEDVRQRCLKLSTYTAIHMFRKTLLWSWCSFSAYHRNCCHLFLSVDDNRVHLTSRLFTPKLQEISFWLLQIIPCFDVQRSFPIRNVISLGAVKVHLGRTWWYPTLYIKNVLDTGNSGTSFWVDWYQMVLFMPCKYQNMSVEVIDKL